MLSAKHIHVQIRCREAMFPGSISDSQAQHKRRTKTGPTPCIKQGSPVQWAAFVIRSWLLRSFLWRRFQTWLEQWQHRQKGVYHLPQKRLWGTTCFLLICNSGALAKTSLPWQVVAENSDRQENSFSPVLLSTSYMFISLLCASFLCL